jgi:phosphatidylglycerol:prolipoprotein diacylglycerol transferase
VNPTLVQFEGGGAINAYGTLILIGTLLSMPGLWWDARSRGIGHGHAASFFVDFYLALAVGAFVGGRLFHVLTVPGDYVADPRRVFVFDGTGFVFFGSLAAIVASWLFLARRHHTRFTTITDLAATWMPLGHAFGRLGCFFAGCCWGAPTDGPLGVEFPADSVVYQADPELRAGDHTIDLLPVQLVEAIGLMVLALVLALVRIRRGIEPPWRQAGRYALGYGVLRLVTETMRGDASRGFLVEITIAPLARVLGIAADRPLALSSSQAIALVLVVAGIVALRRSRAAPMPAAGAS